ncbi:H/ACA ribonucleoprotein complex non-core subunit NAF1 [Anopheles marshallii]|uniref:H/ACA ribonucleoprotein complex non-core subunit NAF1 n=1 Tax=Anopheles marshallii TaxID=1521116 RepID=UPI00237AC737|nr:H/ACA ribonucleoprotein complex non-core subunit NAF1 [Anopheles marshallii]
MEEKAKSPETTNGDRAENKELSQETSVLSTETTIVEKEGGKVNLDAEELMEENPIEPLPAPSGTNPVANEISESSTVEEKLIGIKEAQSAEESSAATVVTETPTGSSEAIDTEEAETVDNKKPEESSQTKSEEISRKDLEETGTMDITAEPANQAMEVEEPVAPVPVTIVSIQEQVAADQKLEMEAVQKISSTSLSMLCQYSGSSDSEAEDTDTPNVVEDAKVNSSSSSSDDSDVEIVKENPLTAGGYRVQDDPILVSDTETMDTNAASSEDENDEPVTGPIRTAGEILPHELPPIEELTITVPETECKPIGHIDSIVAQIVLVQSVPGIELLNLDTVLFLERGKRALGKIFDVIGQVNQPIYCVLFNSNQEILTKNITTGMEVFCAPRTEYTSFIILSELMRTKGSDASWMHDNEIPAYMAEHSDDEEERAAKRNRKKSTANCQQSQNDDDEGSEMGEEQQQQHYHPRQPSPSTSRGHYGRHPPQGGRQFNPRYPSGNSWHHNYNPRFNHPQQYRPRFQQRNHQQFQQIPHMQPPPQGGMMLRNPFAGQGPPRPPSGSN